MAEILAIVLLFGGGAFAAFCYSPIGKAIAARIRGDAPRSLDSFPGTDPAVLEELERLRQELDQVHERLDFTDRLLSNKAPAGLEAGGRPS